MPSPLTLIRKSPIPILCRYCVNIGVELPRVPWDSPDFRKHMTRMYGELSDDLQRTFAGVADRVLPMSDELGSSALRGVAEDLAAFEAIETDLGRAFTMFLDDEARFARAEGVRYSDQRRFGQMWEGYLVERGAEITLDEDLAIRLRNAVAAAAPSSKVHVDVFRRSRQTGPDRDERSDVIQVTIYREGPATEELAFLEDELTTTIRRPVIEGSVTYESKTGAIEVVQKDRESRAQTLRLVANVLLGKEFEGGRIPFKRYDLSSLVTERQFPTDPADRIDAVSIVTLRLKPLGSFGRVTIECPLGEETIWSWTDSNMGPANPLRRSGWAVTHAKLVVTFRSTDGTSRPKRLPVTITMPHGCDLRDRTEKEVLIGQKYLPRWGLMERVDAAVAA